MYISMNWISEFTDLSGMDKRRIKEINWKIYISHS